MSRLEWILTGVLGLLLVVVLVMGLLLWLRPGIGTAPPLPTVDAPVAATPSLVRNTALLAFSSAQAEAQAWQPDAQLVQASATWTQGAGREDLLSGRATWDFTFISPSADATAVFSVIEDEPQLIAENDLQRDVAVQDVSGWRLDSPDAIARVMEEGGEAFLRGAGTTTMKASLDTARHPDKIEWFISLISKYSGNSFTARIDATSGDVLAIETSSP